QKLHEAAAQPCKGPFLSGDVGVDVGHQLKGLPEEVEHRLGPCFVARRAGTEHGLDPLAEAVGAAGAADSTLVHRGSAHVSRYDVSSYRELAMAKAKVAVTLDRETLRRVDRLVQDAHYPNRSQAIEAAVTAHLERLEHRRLADECAKLDPVAERAMAEEGLGF